MSHASKLDPDETTQLDDTVEAKKPFWVRHSTILILALIMLGAVFFRFLGRDFDQNTNQHPDERAVVQATLGVRWPTSFQQLLDPKTSPLNLRSDVACGNPSPQGCEYPWGSLPVYLARGASWLVDTLLPPTPDHPKGYFLNDFTGQEMVGRNVSAIFDLITVLLVFLIARRLYGRGVALIATALTAFAVTEIQIAHFYISEPALVCFMMGAVYFSVVLMQKPSWWAAAGAGACLGFAVASKVTIAFFGLIIIAAIVLRAAYRLKSRKLGADLDDPVGMQPAAVDERNRTFGQHLWHGARYFLIAAIFTVLAFSISEPYALWQFDLTPLQHAAPGTSIGDSVQAVLQSNPWTRRIAGEAAIQSGQADIPYTRQYIGTIPGLYHFEQLVLWGMGVLPGIIGVAGILFAIWLALFRRKPAEILLLAGAIPYYLTIVGLEAKWMRYMLPLVPIVAILGAALLVRGILWSRARFPKRAGEPHVVLRYLQRNFFTIVTVTTVGFAILWTVAFANIYTQDESRVQASAWIYANVPDGSSISNEGWDDALPVGLPSAPGSEPRDGGSRGYKGVTFNLYDDHPPDEELSYISGLLNQTDYIALSSDRLYGSIPRLPWRYPIQTMFYQLLYAGKLGYQLVHTTQVTPELLGIKINDQLADESFTVYDHPRVDIFKKVSSLTDQQLQTLFATALNRPPGDYSTERHGQVDDNNSLMLKGSLADQPDVGNYAWNPLAQDNTQPTAVLLWLVAIYILGFAAMPLVFTIFKRLPDKGYPLAKLAGLLLVSWGVWILASARLMIFQFWTVLLVLLLLAGLGLLCWRLGAGQEIKAFWRQRRGVVFFYEALFLIGFAAFILIRMLNPDLWQTSFGGEKPMDVGFLNAILRSPYMPPADPFFAGGIINYYYQGQFILATLIKLVGINAAIAFNLSIALLYGLTLTVGGCLVYNVVAWSQRRRGSTSQVSGTGMAFAVLGGVLMLVIGNMHALMQVIMINFPNTAHLFIGWAQNLGFIGPSWTNPYTQFNFWDPSRIINGTINEFPFWSFLYADLHPHLIDMPFTLLAAAFGLNLAFAGRFVPPTAGLSSPSWHASLMVRVRASLAWLWGAGWGGVLTFALMALSLGVLFAVNTWDWPTYFGLAAGATLIALLLSRKISAAESSYDELPAREAPEADESRLGAFGAWTLAVTGFASVVAVALFSLGAYLPFFLNFKAFYSKLLPITDGGLVPGTDTVMHRTTVAEYLVIWALFVFIALSYLILRLWHFPWSAAFADIANILPAGRREPQASLAPTQAFTARPKLSLFGARRLALSPALATGAAGSMAFASDPGGQDYSSPVSISDQAPEDGVDNSDAPPASIEPSAEAATANTLGEATVEAGPDGAAGTLGQETWPPQHEPEEQSTNGATGDGADFNAATSNWVAEAHTEAQRQTVAVPARYQPGVIPLWAGLLLLALTAGGVILQLATHQFLLALLVALIGGLTATLLSTTRSVSALFGGLLLVTALLVSLGVEVVYLADHLSGGDQFRMNTVFKFYIQVWLLFGTGGAIAVYYMLFGVRERFAGRRTTINEPELSQVAEPDESLGAATRPLVASEEVDDLAPNGNGNGQAITEPLGGTVADAQHERNWLIWSADEIGEHEPPAEPAEQVDPEQSAPAGLVPPAAPAESQALEQDNSTLTWAPATYPAPITEAEEPEPADLLNVRWTGGRIAWTAAFGVLLVVSLLFTWYGTQDKLRYRFPVTPPIGTLNGTAYMDTATFGTTVQGPQGDVPVTVNLKYDHEAINWLNQHVTGLATIAELPMEYYRSDGMRAASNTGLPMVIGGLHQDEQRAETYARLVGDRQTDMNNFFTTTDIQQALTIMSKYDIQYIYLGQLEQAKAGEAGVKKFQQLADPKVGILKQVFASDNPPDVPGTIIYEVNTAPDKDPKTLVGSPVANSGLPGISITPLPTSTPVPPPTPPVNNPELNQLIADVTANPTNPDKRMALVDWYKQNGFHLEAAEQLAILSKAQPTNVALWSQLGDEYTAANRPDDALKAWESGRDNSPNNPDAHNKLGIAYFTLKRYDDAQKEFQAAVNADKNFVESWFHLGEVYERKGDVDNAKKAYQGAIDNSKDANGWKDSAQARLNALK